MSDEHTIEPDLVVLTQMHTRLSDSIRIIGDVERKLMRTIAEGHVHMRPKEYKDMSDELNGGTRIVAIICDKIGEKLNEKYDKLIELEEKNEN